MELSRADSNNRSWKIGVSDMALAYTLRGKVGGNDRIQHAGL